VLEVAAQQGGDRFRGSIQPLSARRGFVDEPLASIWSRGQGDDSAED
jgi:hypothetical protein